MKFEYQVWEYLKESVNSLILKKLVPKRDEKLLRDRQWLNAAFGNWMNEPQFSSRCPECQIDIVGPRKLMHMHLKYHEEKRTERRELEPFTAPFRIHMPRVSDFKL